MSTPALLHPDAPAAAALFVQRQADHKVLAVSFRALVQQASMARAALVAALATAVFTPFLLVCNVLPFWLLDYPLSVLGVKQSVELPHEAGASLVTTCVVVVGLQISLCMARLLAVKPHAPRYCDAVTLLRHVIHPSYLVFHVTHAACLLTCAWVMLENRGQPVLLFSPTAQWNPCSITTLFVTFVLSIFASYRCINKEARVSVSTDAQPLFQRLRGCIHAGMRVSRQLLRHSLLLSAAVSVLFPALPMALLSPIVTILHGAVTTEVPVALGFTQFVASIPTLAAIVGFLAISTQICHVLVSEVVTERLNMWDLSFGITGVKLPQYTPNSGLHVFSDKQWHLDPTQLLTCAFSLANASSLTQYMVTHNNTKALAKYTPATAASKKDDALHLLAYALLLSVSGGVVVSIGLGTLVGAMAGVLLGASAVLDAAGQKTGFASVYLMKAMPPSAMTVTLMRYGFGALLGASVSARIGLSVWFEALLSSLCALGTLAVFHRKDLTRIITASVAGGILGCILAICLSMIVGITCGTPVGLTLGVVVALVLAVDTPGQVGAAPSAVSTLLPSEGPAGSASGTRRLSVQRHSLLPSGVVANGGRTDAADALAHKLKLDSDRSLASTLASIAKVTEVADLKRRCTLLVTRDASALLRVWKERLNDGEAELYAGKSRLVGHPLPAHVAMARELAFADVAMNDAKRLFTLVFADGTGQRWLDWLLATTGVIDALAIAVKTASISGVAPAAAKHKTLFARVGGHTLLAGLPNELFPYDPVVEQVRWLKGGVARAKLSISPPKPAVKDQDANPDTTGPATTFGNGLEFPYVSTFASDFLYKDLFEDKEKRWQHDTGLKPRSHKAAADSAVPPSMSAPTGFEHDDDPRNTRHWWVEPEDPAAEFGMFRHLLLRLRRSADEKTAELFDDAPAVMCCARILSSCVAHAVELDDYGVVEGSLTVILSSLLNCLMAVEAYVTSPAYFGRFSRGRFSDRVQPIVVANALKTAIMDIEDALGDQVETLELPHQLAARFERPITVEPVPTAKHGTSGV